ncbi:MAG TPA: hypothetical protein VNN55_06445 [bacterium]|nr:hypothetical protein [bacterium]
MNYFTSNSRAGKRCELLRQRGPGHQSVAKRLRRSANTGQVGCSLRTNIRLTLEKTYDIEDEENRLVMGVVTAF